MFAKRFTKTAVSMLAATLVSALLVVGCSDDDDNGANGGGGGNRDSRLVLPSGYAWLDAHPFIGDREGFFFNEDGTVLYLDDVDPPGVWLVKGTGTWSTSGNNTITINGNDWTSTFPYTVTSTTFTVHVPDEGDRVYAKTAVTIP